MNDYRGKKYGNAGGNLGDGHASKQFGRANASAGRSGEEYLSRALSRNPKTNRYAVYQSMRVPRPAGQKDYGPHVDIDFVIASGNKVVLVDCKRWSAKHFYWSFFGRLMKDWTPGDKLSRNMEMSLSRTRKLLPGAQVTALVCFVPVKGGRLPKGVGLLIWPGKIRSYLANDAISKISSYLGEPKAPSADIQALMGRLTR